MYWLACNWYNSIIIKSFLAPLRSAVLQFTAKLTTAHNTLANAYFLLLQEAKVGWRTVALQSEIFECATVDLQFLTCQKVANYDCGAKAIARDEILCYNNLFLLWICIYYPFLINQLISVFLNVDTTPVPHSCLLFIDLLRWICYLWIKYMLFIVDIHCSFTLKCVPYMTWSDVVLSTTIYKTCVVFTFTSRSPLLHQKLCLMYLYDLSSLFIFVWRAI